MLANEILNNIGDAGQKKRKVYQRTLEDNPNKDYYYIQRLTPNTEALLIEYGFIDNANDVKKLDNNLLTYAEGVVKAVADYAGVPYKTTTDDDTYIVKAGDTIYSIAKKYNLTVNELKSLNNLTSNLISIGQVLKVTEQTPSFESGTYTVKKGDTLYAIANKYGLTIDELKSINNLTSNNLSIGQVLNVSTANPNTYTVQKGDTLYSISRRFNIPVQTLKVLNNLNTDLLFVGQILNIS